MTTTIAVRACTLAELAAASPELDWNPVLHPAGERAGEPVRASGLAALDRAASRAVRRTLPAEPGLYAWTTQVAGRDGSHQAEVEALIYLGVAAGRRGLAARLGDELRYVWNGTRRDDQWRQENYHGHPRTMLDYDAQVHYAVAPDSDPETVRELERQLLAVTGYVTGLTPLANGSGWHSDTRHQVPARKTAWTRARDAGLLHDEPTP